MAYVFLVICVFAVCLKLLFIPMYYSTDMEVHRNWMAVTHNKPLKDWYTEATSQWTLDYPPLFAWFEYGLSFVAKYFDPGMLSIQEHHYMSRETLVFMRISVIVADVFYMLAIKRIYSFFTKSSPSSCDPWLRVEVVFAMLMLLNPGLLLVDHIHFQYNGFLFGLLFMSIAAMKQGKYLESAFWYTVLINFKHLYLCLAPAYFIFLLKNYCFTNHKHDGEVVWKSFSMKSFLKLSVLVVAVTALSFGPFLLVGSLSHVVHRMFPVKRGLTHAYWAPNFWALYNALDCALVAMARRMGWKHFSSSDFTKGLVQEYNHKILPSVGVKTTIVLSVLSVLPFLWKVWKKPKSVDLFVRCLISCAFGSFIFGYHVHEKAILTVILPFTLLAVCNSDMIANYVLLSSAGHFALFPLLYESAETSIKVVIFILHVAYTISALTKRHRKESISSFPRIMVLLLIGIPVTYGLGFGAIKLAGLDTKLTFFPLMVISCYCSICIIYCWTHFCSISLNTTPSSLVKRKAF